MLGSITKDNFNQLLGRFSTGELEKLIEKHPYFQQAHVLLAKKYQQEHNPKFDEQLQLAALYTQDREFLFSIFQDEIASTDTIEPVTSESSTIYQDVEDENAIADNNASFPEPAEEQTVTNIISIALEEEVNSETLKLSVEPEKEPIQNAEVAPLLLQEEEKVVEVHLPLIEKEEEPATEVSFVEETRLDPPVFTETVDEQSLSTETDTEKELFAQEEESLVKAPTVEDTIDTVADTFLEAIEEIEIASYEQEEVVLPEKTPLLSEEEVKVNPAKEPDSMEVADEIVLPVEMKAKKEIVAENENPIPTEQVAKEEKETFVVTQPHTFDEWLSAFSKLEEIAPEPEKQDEELEQLIIANLPVHELMEEETHYSKGLDVFIEEQKQKHKPQEVRMPVYENELAPELITETMAKIYEMQKKYPKAIRAYEILALKYPEKNDFFAARINYLKNII